MYFSQGASSLLIALLPALATSSPIQPRSTYPDPIPLTGNITWVHDPALIKRDDGTWFRLSTVGNIAIASAPDITGPWTYLGSMLPDGSSINVADDQGLWAPDTSYIDGQYVTYYAVSTSGSQDSDIGYATSDDLTPGSWTDHGSLGLPQNSDYNIIDPNRFHQDGDDTVYFQFGSSWDDIYQTTLESDSLAWDSSASVDQLSYNSTGSIEEGSYLFWWPVDGTDYYYLFFSSGVCCAEPPNLVAQGLEYKVMVCRAESPTGPFKDQDGVDCKSDNGGTLILGSHGEVYAPGGQGVLYDSTVSSNPVIYYHYVNTTIGYAYKEFQFGINYLDFSSGWPVVTA